MRFQRLNNAIHRDLGYFMAGTAILYSLSGLALNHADAWNPNFVIEQREVRTADCPAEASAVSDAWVLEFLETLGNRDYYLGHDAPSPGKLKIYLDDGSVMLDLKTGEGVWESVRRRPLFYHANLLHIGAKGVWALFADFFAASLIVLAVTGLFVLKGKHGFARRGWILVGAGLILPAACVFWLGR